MKDMKMMSEPWDDAGAYEMGKAAEVADWTEWNEELSDKVRSAVRGDEGMMEGLKE